MKFSVDWKDCYDVVGPQEIHDPGGRLIAFGELIGKRILGVVEDDFEGLVFEV
jgi:hypothetical protein